MFKIGEPVTWTSQASGVTKTKTGIVVAVVPEHTDPSLYVPEGMRLKSYGSPRIRESYLVRVGKRKCLHWPIVSLLKPVDPHFIRWIVENEAFDTANMTNIDLVREAMEKAFKESGFCEKYTSLCYMADNGKTYRCKAGVIIEEAPELASLKMSPK